MLVLLFLSSLAAALAPVDQRRDETSTTTTPAPDPDAERSALVRAQLDAGAKRPETVRARVGDQLQLRVTGRRPATIELAGLGEAEDVDPAAPALFDILLDTEGEIPVRELESGRRVGTIEVRPPRRPAPTAPESALSQSRS